MGWWWVRSAAALVWLAAGARAAAPADVPVETRVAPPATLADLRAGLLGRVAGGELPSVAVGVIQGGRVVWEEAFGWAERGSRQATADTPYGVASLGKSVTAMAVVALAERGLVDLEAPVERYLGAGALAVHEGEAAAVTVRRLLDMSAAIPHGWYVYSSAADAAAMDAERLTSLRGQVVFPAGEVEVYSNLAYGVVERLIERVAGRDYPEFLAAEIFGPLGMTHSLVAGSTSPPGAAIKYDADGQRLAETFPRPASSLAMHCSLSDLLRYAALHLGEPLAATAAPVGPAALVRMHEERSKAPHALMALGWGSLELPDGGRWLLTNGRAGGAQATLTLLPSAGLAVVVLTNVTGNDADATAFGIADRLAPGFLAAAGRVQEAYEAWAQRPYEPSPDWLGRWRGAIETPAGPLALALDFQADGDVHVELGDEDPTLLSGLAWDAAVLMGRFRGRLPLEEASEHPHRIDLALRPNGSSLSGWAVAVVANGRGRFELPAYVRLERAPEP